MKKILFGVILAITIPVWALSPKTPEQEGIIYHMVSRAYYENYLLNHQGGDYLPDGFDAKTQGKDFIHCTIKEEDLLQIANKYSKSAQGDFIILVLDVRKISPKIDYDKPKFPHIYGAIDKDAIINTMKMPRAADGTFLPFKTRENIMSAIAKNRILGGMHEGGSVETGSLLVQEGIIPEFGDLRVLKRFSRLYPDTITACGIKNDLNQAIEAAINGADILVSSDLLSPELIKQIRSLFPRIVIISGARDRAECHEGIQNGADGIKLKPWDNKDGTLINSNLELIKELKRDYPGILFFGAGGVSAKNISMTLADVSGVGIGFDNPDELKDKLSWIDRARKPTHYRKTEENKTSVAS